MGEIMAETGNAIQYALNNATGDMLNVDVAWSFADRRWMWTARAWRNGALFVGPERGRLGVSAHEDDQHQARTALAVFVSFLTADGEKYARVMGPITDKHEDGYIFGEKVAEWAYQNLSELEYVSAEMEYPGE